MADNIDMNENQNAVSPAELESFRASLENLLVVQQAREYPLLAAPKVSVDRGVKRARIVRSDGPASRSAYCFIDMASGDIFKCAGWSAPAKHARGNIRTGDASSWWNGALDVYGAAYLR
jgi:hypothetical protein